MKRKTTPQAAYRAEKARIQRRATSSHAQLMAEAKRLYEAQLEHDRATRKGGRPKKKTVPAGEDSAAELGE
jgi:hypothetical protein